LFRFYAIERAEVRLWQYFCALLALGFLDFAAESFRCSWII